MVGPIMSLLWKTKCQKQDLVVFLGKELGLIF